jgi:hypothetical protein
MVTLDGGDSKCLQKIQKRAIRMVSGLRSDIYDDKLRELGLTTLEERRHRLDMLKTYKILMREGEVRIWFQTASNRRKTGY